MSVTVWAPYWRSTISTSERFGDEVALRLKSVSSSVTEYEQEVEFPSSRIPLPATTW